MAFADGYSGSTGLLGQLVAGVPPPDLSIIVTIPAFDEPDAAFTLDSLLACEKPPCDVEVIIGVNSPPSATTSQLKGSEETLLNLHNWAGQNVGAWFGLHVINMGQPAYPKWGVGMARKALMDEAAARFNIIGNRNGVIACLDADCRVSPNYFTRLYKDLYLDPGSISSVLYFEHDLEKVSSPSIREAINQYELHLRYYYQGLRYTGFNQVFHTVGSTIAVKAEAYLKSGGMNRRQGGEDFYFIQKLIPAGKIRYITKAIVFPAARISDRVPFGTGPAIRDLSSQERVEYMTYDPAAFDQPRILIAGIHDLYEPGDKADRLVESIPEPLCLYLERIDFSERLVEIRSNTSTPASFTKRFLGWFNMFRMVKYLNWSHTEDWFSKWPVKRAASGMMLKASLGDPAEETSELLQQYRRLEK